VNKTKNWKIVLDMAKKIILRCCKNGRKWTKVVQKGLKRRERMTA
jgi:hypothetical protein